MRFGSINTAIFAMRRRRRRIAQRAGAAEAWQWLGNILK
jgi:hypothetical protein